MLIIDTNILLDFPQIIEEETGEELVIATDVLKELDGLKLHNSFDVSFKARRAAVLISHNMDKLIWDDSLEKERYDSVDDKLIQITKNRNGTLVTNDVYLKVKAITKGVKTKAYGKTEADNGIKERAGRFISPSGTAVIGKQNQRIKLILTQCKTIFINHI